MQSEVKQSKKGKQSITQNNGTKNSVAKGKIAPNSKNGKNNVTKGVLNITSK